MRHRVRRLVPKVGKTSTVDLRQAVQNSLTSHQQRKSPPLWIVALALLLGACSSDNAPTGLSNAAPEHEPTARVDVEACATPQTGCSCEEEGQSVDCGRVSQEFGSYVTCSMGTRTCSDGAWSACVGDRVTVKSLPPTTPGQHTLALGASAKCPDGFDVCDPYCSLIPDTPGGFTAGSGFSNVPGGLTLVGTLPQICTSLALTPSTATVAITGSSITSLSASPVTFTLTAAPSGCTTSSFQTTWTIDRFDRAVITGTTNMNGSLAVSVPIGGPIVVRAYALGLSASTTVQLKVNVLESAAAAPNQAASSTQVTAFGSVGSPNVGVGASSATWLYPYNATYFPLALPAPIAQYRYVLSAGDATGSASAVKLSIRYPSGSTATGATFNYSMVVKESNAVTCNADATQCNYVDPQVVIPQTAWRYFEQSARGQDADLIVQRLRSLSSGLTQLELEKARTIHFVDGQLKGTVYYNSYTSPQGGNTGAILRIAPGATSPTLAVQPSGTCSTCHSINLDGTRLITNGGKDSSGNYSFDRSENYDPTTSSPSPTVLNTYTDNRYTFGGPWKDGSLYMSHGGSSDPEWHAPSAPSLLYKPSDSTTSVTLNNWPTNVQAVTPRFSPDGTKLAFGFWSGTSLPCATGAISPCTASPLKLPPAAAGTRLAVMDFTCASPPCSSTSTGWSVSNARDVTPNVTDRVAWPSFTPDGNAVAYQRQIRSSKAILSWAASDIGTIAGALSEIWLSNIPADGSTAAIPTRLLGLNGLDSAGASYLPQQARTVVVDTNPLYKFKTVRRDMSQTVTSGSAGPAVVATGATTGGPWDFRIKIVANGSVGTAKFQYSTNGGSSWSATTTTATTVSLTSGLSAQFATGTYNSTSVYQALVDRVAVQGTPTGGPWDFRIQIVTTGALGTATFKYSSDGGSTWLGPLPTAASVSLGTTGLVATFANVTYSSASWSWGAYVSHLHQDNGQFTINEADNCDVNGTATNVYDSRVNYLPSFAPTDVGGKSWVVFTSRRMYGNIAYENGWDAEPGYSCGSGKTPAKKLWIAAVDSPVSPGSDPSHPAFYLPGQELAAGNSDGHWVSSACGAVDTACQSDDDCCGGTGASPTTQCRVTDATTSPVTRLCRNRGLCAPAGNSCTTTANCCTGLTCPTGGGLCLAPPSSLLFDTQTLTREYAAQCPTGTKPKWRFFMWRDTIPTGASIGIAVQSKRLATDSYLPATPINYATATQSSSGTNWLQGASPIDTLLESAGVGSQTYLQVTMVFRPDSLGTVAPTLLAWQQSYDCVPAE